MIWKAYLDHAYAQNLAKPPFMCICRKFENWRNLRVLSGKFLRQKSCYPESFCFLWLCPGCVEIKNMRGFTRFPECQAHKRVKMKRTNCVWTLTPKPIYWNKWLPTEELELKKKWGKGGNTLWENLYQKYLADRSILEILFDRLEFIKCHIVKLGSAVKYWHISA